jgi:hypothetical protein
VRPQLHRTIGVIAGGALNIAIRRGKVDEQARCWQSRQRSGRDRLG